MDYEDTHGWDFPGRATEDLGALEVSLFISFNIELHFKYHISIGYTVI